MLQGPPSHEHLSRMYYELAKLGAHCSGEKLAWPYQTQGPEETFALAAQMSRYDPRLLGILVEYLLKNWPSLVPQRLRSCYPLMQTPQSIAVIAEFIKSTRKDPEVIYFMQYLQQGLKPVPTQLYFKDLYSPGSRLMQKTIEEGLVEYKRWGFLSREFPTIDTHHKKTLGHLDRDSRINILKRLFSEHAEIAISDYLKKLHHHISRQQALKDLGSIARLKQHPQGRGAKWVIK